MRRTVACLLLSLLGSVALFASQAALETRTFSLRHITSKDALVVVRTILEIRQVEVVDDATFKATATADRLEMAAQILSLVDREETAAQVDTIADGSEIVIAVAPLRGTPPAVVMKELREMGIRKIVVMSIPDLVVIRDSESQTKAALERLESLRQPQPE